MADHNPAARVDLDARLSEGEQEALRAAMLMPQAHRIAVVERILADRLAPLLAELRDAQLLAGALTDELDVAARRYVAAEAERDEARAEGDALRERVEALADEWEAIDKAKPYALTHIADCADDLRALADPEAS